MKTLEKTASLRWEIKDSFRNYVIGVGGTIEVTTPASVADTYYEFPRSATSASAAAAGSVLMFRGAVSFTAHHGLLRLVVADPWIHFGGRYGQLSIGAAAAADVVGSRIIVADLEIPEAAKRGEILCWTGAGTRLAKDGAAAFDFNYPPGTELSPISFSWPLTVNSAREDRPASARPGTGPAR
jgi:hypothetical protein